MSSYEFWEGEEPPTKTEYTFEGNERCNFVGGLWNYINKDITFENSPIEVEFDIKIK